MAQTGPGDLIANGGTALLERLFLRERDRVEEEREKRLTDSRTTSREEIAALRATIAQQATHFTAEIAALKDLFTQRFEASDKAVLAALAAAEKAVTAAFESAEKAITKAEEAQLRFNTTTNEFRGTLRDQNAATERTMMPRAETELIFRELRGQIAAAQTQITDALGQRTGHAEQRTEGRASVGSATAIIAALIAAGLLFVAYQGTQEPTVVIPPTITVPQETP